MLADDLRRRITLQPLRAGIPVHDDAAWIEHVEGAVLHGFDQEAELALAFVERVLRLSSLGNVAGDLGEADGATSRISDRLDDRGRPEPAAILADAPSLLLGAPSTACAGEHFARHVD